MFSKLKTIFYVSRGLSYRFGNSVQIIDVPFCGGQPKGGVELAPKFLKELGLVTRVESLGLTVHEHGKVEPNVTDHIDAVYSANPVVKNPVVCGGVAKATSEAVLNALNNNRMAITVGGDHSIATGTVFGSWKFDNNTCVIWVDAHADLNSPLITTTGNVHGMPISWLLKGIPEFPVVPGYEWVNPCLDPNKLAYIGLRDVEPQEAQLLNEIGVTAFTIEDIDEIGIEATMEKALDAINPNREFPIHVSFDIDAMDPDHLAPSTGTKVRGGLSNSEGHYICQLLSQTGLLQAIDLVEVNPTLGTEKEARQTAETALSLLETLLGKRREIPKEKLIPYNQMIKNFYQ
ncbi:predicted protein [Nematostella vectensis]|uniref:Arginase n=1 Tax=Nematostella vectensis TaxID=45351 RepID=A7RZV8_NEMVE|nr:arginase, hepatic [Nematostella vectensis]EDO43058.1 predicted protein [Nematostella vectensis]|eukprot:XP_001635121.1 predicted protein [Nematostella vectensis]